MTDGEGGRLAAPGFGPSSLVDGESLRAHTRQSAVLNLVGQGVTLAAALGSSALLARVLPPEGYGRYLLILAVVTFSATLIQNGGLRTVVRLVSRSIARGDRRHAALLARAISGMVVLSSLLAIPILGGLVFPLLLGRVFGRELAALAWVVALLAASEACRPVFSEGFRGFHDVKRATVLGDPLRALLILLAVFIAWRSGTSLTLRGVLWMVTAVSAFVAALSGFTLWRSTRRISPPMLLGGAVRPVVGAAAVAGLPVMASELASQAIAQGDLLIVGAVASDGDLALYGASLRIAVMLQLPFVILAKSLSPIMTDLHTRGERVRLEGVLRSAALASSVPVVLAFIATLLFGDVLLRVAFGAFYGKAASILPILCFAPVVGTITGMCGTLLIMTGHARAVVAATVAIGTLTLGAEALVAPRAGIMGVAIVSTMGTVVQNVTMVVLAKTSTGILTLPTTSLGFLKAAFRRLPSAR